MSGRPQMTEQSENQLSQLRLWSELFAVATMFVIFSIILFSVQKDIPENISFTISHWLFFGTGCLSLLFATIFGVLLFWTSKAKDLAYWLERSYTHPTLRVAFWEIFWPLFWVGASLTFIVALADVSNRLPDFWHPIALIGGSFLYIVIAANLIWRGLRTWRREMTTGFLLRDTFDKELKGQKTWCGVCGKSGVIGTDLTTVYFSFQDVRISSNPTR